MTMTQMFLKGVMLGVLMKIRYVFALALIILLSLAGCARQQPGTPEAIPAPISDEDYNTCTADEDCICKGIHPNQQRCFIGNKAYYEAKVDKREDCPASDFCKGPDGNLVIKCLGGRCIQMPECSFDLECGEERRCVKNKCV
jgi:hypothetical protein